MPRAAAAGARPRVARASAGSWSRTACRSRSAPGDLLGIVGPNGAGKTSLFGLISGDLDADAGRDQVRRRRRSPGSAPPARCRLGIGRTFQVPRPFGDMTVFENVLVAAQQGAGLRRQASYDARGAGAGADRAGSAEANMPGRAARPAPAQAAGAGPGAGDGAAAAAARRGGRRPDRPRGRPAGRDRQRVQRRGRRDHLDRARGARADRERATGCLPGRRRRSSATASPPRCSRTRRSARCSWAPR